jgi:ubiquinone/menaquinone biosynthesis C-methylase UbiE
MVEETVNEVDDASFWSNYWRQGLITTFSGGSFEQGYEGPIAHFWQTVLDSVPDDGRILDLATGNGAIPALCLSYGKQKGRSWHITGIDYARINPPEFGSAPARGGLQERVNLRGETRMEKTGLASNEFDLITSQFGIEYGDIERTASEVWRLLAFCGTLACVMHHPNSQIVKDAQRDFLQTKMVLDEERLDRKVKDLALVVASHSTPESRRVLKYKPEAERLRRRLNNTIRRLTDKVDPADERQILKITQTYLRIFGDLKDRSRDEKLEFIRQYSESLRAYAGRMEAMFDATLSDEQFQLFLETLKAAGLQIRETAILYHEDGATLGRTVVARKS